MQIFDLTKLGGWCCVLLMGMMEEKAYLEGKIIILGQVK